LKRDSSIENREIMCNVCLREKVGGGERERDKERRREEMKGDKYCEVCKRERKERTETERQRRDTNRQRDTERQRERDR